jgi:hypothetical protein
VSRAADHRSDPVSSDSKKGRALESPTSVTLNPELRSWIDQVIVPILVSEFLREKGLPGGHADG